MSIILIGMPSCGKSTLGVLLAKKLGMEFIDSDLLIQKKHQKLLHELIKEHGNDGFLEIESEVNCSMTEQNAVIATGGSAVYSERAMRHFATIGNMLLAPQRLFRAAPDTGGEHLRCNNPAASAAAPPAGAHPAAGIPELNQPGC